jgi:ribonuclease J
MVKWMKYFGIECDYEINKKKRTFKRRHVSGHACKIEIEEMIKLINPAKIIPIHSENPQQFENMFENQVILPKYAKSIEI